MNIILGLLLVLIDFSAETPEIITLPGGRNISDPTAYGYLEEHTGSTILREYVLIETRPTTAIMCPKGYSVGEISQVLLLHSNVSDEVGEIPFQSTPQIASVGQLRIPDAACPRLFECLAYQACLFKFGNEFCGRDVAPRIRKLLLVNVTCFSDSQIHESNDRRSDLVLYMAYTSRLEDGIRDYSGTTVKHIEIPEVEVFGGHCPPLDAVLEQGYAGSCIQDPVLSPPVKEKIWSILGRTSSKKCREELTQVYCAFLYNSQGLCVPPIFHEKMSKMVYNFRSLPTVGDRPNDVFHEQFLNTSHLSLVPARLAFLVLLHKDIPAAIDLLELIYRPYNWYVIHVDSRAHTVREELYHTLKQVFREATNIFVLPEERSFPTSWGSYDIVRSELEGFEELLRRGVWDFAINLSGADYPLRNVDDLAAALAPYRGMNFLPFAEWKKMNDSNNDSDLSKKAFYACDGYVYDVKVTPGLPNTDDLKIYNSPQWGVFSRDFISYLVNASARSDNLNRFQFYLQTHVVPDESYIPTVLMNSKFKSTLRTAFIHTSKEFASDNINNLCRHSNDADFCGQGPGIYDLNDVPDLLSASYRSFFARKFPTELSDRTRGVVRDLSQKGYYEFFKQHLPEEILKTVAKNAMSLVFGKASRSPPRFSHILHLRVLPSLLPHDPCCQTVFLSRIRNIIDYIFWLDFSFIDTESGEVKDARVTLEPSLNGRVCYSDGHLKMAFVTPWTRKVQNLKYGEYSPRAGLDQTLPLPYGPAYVSDISVVLFFSRDAEDASNCSNEGHLGIPIIFPNSDAELLKPVVVILKVVAPDQRIQCVHTQIIQWDFKNQKEQSPDMIFPIMINCGVMQPGPWQILMSQVDVNNGRIYSFPFYLLDFSQEKILSHQLSDAIHLWKVKESCLLFEGKPYFGTSTPRAPQMMREKIWFRGRSYEPHYVIRKFPQVVQLTTTALTSGRFVDLDMTSLRDRPTSICILLWSVGTAATLLCCILVYLWLCQNRVPSVFHHRLLFIFLLFTAVAVIQIIISLSFC